MLTLHDRDIIALFLSKMAEEDRSLPLSSFIVAACREFGWNTFARELKQLLIARPERHTPGEIPPRDIEWLSAFCLDKAADEDKAALARELCALAVQRFCEPRPPRAKHYSAYRDEEVSAMETSLPLLLKALAASDLGDELTRVIRFVQETPDEFSLDDCQVPSLKSVIPWSQKKLGAVHPSLASWLAAVQQQLEAATAIEPAPPTDWARPASVECDCRYCAQLKAFLADSENEVGRIPAPEHDRQHLIGRIERHECDVKHALEKKGSPYSLVLTKTTGSFERAVKRYEADCRLLRALPVAE